MKKSVMSIEEPIFEGRIDIVKENSGAMHSYGDVIIASKY